jgi:two-component system nitrogen regulation response regulator NtrX
MAHEILIVDDEDDIRLLIAGILEDEGYETRDASTTEDALEKIGARRPSLVILDIWLEGSRLDGMELLHVIRREHPGLPVVMISGHGSIETAVQAIKIGAYDYVEKPFKTDRLILIVRRAIEAARLRRENEELRLRAGPETELVGDSQPMAALRQTIDKVAPTGSRVLISGAAGAGKEVAARMIHARSRRAEQPFVVVNCAAMAPERMESELFGVEAARALDQDGRKIGLFEQAHNGTLLFDEVGDMPLETQGKIVRVLQDQTFEQVGGHQKIEVDVRVVATTTRDLRSEIEAGRFREDLFYRLNVVPVEMPDLTDRREDIPKLADHFMRRASETGGMPVRRIGPDAMTALQAHNWPGNVRQLRNVIEWLLIMAPTDPQQQIRSDMLPPELIERTPAALQGAVQTEFLTLGLRDAREEFERQYLEAQVNRFGGNISKTATFVGMERSALHRKLKSLGVQGPTIRSSEQV